MKKIALGILALIAVAVLAVLGLASTKPDHIHVERTVEIAATAADMAPFAEDLRKVQMWSPWNEKDPTLVPTYSDPSTGVGATYSWKGNDQVGEGSMTTTSSVPGKVVHHLHFIAPFEGQADATIAYEEAGDGLTVVWSYDDPAALFMTKVMTVFVDMDDMLGPDYEKGLKKLKPLVEAAAAERMAAEKAAADKAAAEATAAAEGAEDGETPAPE